MCQTLKHSEQDLLHTCSMTCTGRMTATASIAASCSSAVSPSFPCRPWISGENLRTRQTVKADNRTIWHLHIDQAGNASCWHSASQGTYLLINGSKASVDSRLLLHRAHNCTSFVCLLLAHDVCQPASALCRSQLPRHRHHR